MGFSQKKIALINDITGFGRCSIAVSLPIISALKVQCCFIPTAILSNHTGFNNFFFEDYTPKMKEYINNWEILDLSFDGICTGFLGSKEQIKIVIDFLKKFKTKNNIVLIDPVMGDYGKLYSTYTDEMCKEMQNLIKYADVITPNLTELCRLLDIPYPDETPTHEELNLLCEKLSLQGPSKIVITGLQRQGAIENFIFEINKSYKVIQVEKIGDDRSGTGDVFSSIVSASIVKGEDFAYAIEKATSFISKSLKFTTELNLPGSYGVCFEEFLTELK
ncbi:MULTISPECIES: pyridoxamine kinase [unclassified Clostridium]|jgi:pyridoxine kinase|uniref:pyridoxamine kinase n=1 Tax=Clostridium TaxID=1485 RepID=UPI0018ABDF7E|nr:MULTISPECIES: pyridoxamine kinase [unclassified Clostridium]MBX9137608.1 pyridoxamine kinase [Clostridium sp. K12(2020)]MBX9144418.1 pyridoxamine kinase [Clostridium sp. K13]MDU2290745.1 pyridoxamine kinase [Clostridium celatum]MDU4327189.1 pyridoxamine kinase [Clostridium celatum]